MQIDILLYNCIFQVLIYYMLYLLTILAYLILSQFWYQNTAYYPRTPRTIPQHVSLYARIVDTA